MQDFKKGLRQQLGSRHQALKVFYVSITQLKLRPRPHSTEILYNIKDHNRHLKPWQHRLDNTIVTTMQLV